MSYDTSEDKYTEWLFPYKIDFLDYIKFETNNNVYISDIHKHKNISGTNMMHTVLKLLKVLHADEVTVHDGSSIDCGHMKEAINLSFFKLVEKNTTFYQKFGFKLSIGNREGLILRYKTDENMNKVLLENLDKFRKIKLEYYKTAYTQILDILTSVVKKQDYHNLDIQLYHELNTVYVDKLQLREKVLQMIRDINDIFFLFKIHNEMYLYKLMIKLFYDQCNDYVILVDVLLKNLIYSVQYNGNKIILKHTNIFVEIIDIIRYSIYSLKLNI